MVDAEVQDGNFEKSRDPQPQANTAGNIGGCNARSNGQVLACPECGTQKLFKDGLRYLFDRAAVQRWLCRNCGYRFSEKEPRGSTRPLQKTSGMSQESQHVSIVETQSLKGELKILSDCRVCVSEREAKNLATVDSREERPMREGSMQAADVKGRLIEFAWHLKKDGKSPSTIQVYGVWLNTLLKRGANLTDPESVKGIIARQENWTSTSKVNAVAAYKAFADFLGITWKPPKYVAEQRMPFIPLESELDALIAASGKKTSAILELLKETGMRSGEAWRLVWTDVDLERLVVSINAPEKRSNSRVIKVSPKLAGMLNALPRTNQKVFGQGNIMTWRRNFQQARKRVAAKLQNPRLERITFHTFRHWKATMEYHRTRDPYYVKQLLGHKSLRNTEIYINIEHAIFQSETDEFNVKVAEKPEEIKTLLEVGFEYVCEKDGLMFFRKRK